MKRLELVSPVESGTAVMPSRRTADGAIVYGLFEDRPPPYLSVVRAGRGEGVQDSDGSGGDG